MFKKLQKKEFFEIAKIEKAFSIDFYSLPVELDYKFIKNIQHVINQEPFLINKKVLFLSNPQFKYHEKNILLFLNRKFKKCDCYHIDHPNYSLKTKLENVYYIPKTNIPCSFYDYVIVYKGIEFLSQEIKKIKSKKFFVFLTNSDDITIRQNLKIYENLYQFQKKIIYFNLFKDALPCIGGIGSCLNIKASINWPPSLDIFYKVPQKLLFDYLFMGGGARDYKFIYDNRKLFKDKKIIITHCDAKKHYKSHRDYAYDTKYLNLLKKNKKIICLNRINETLYCRLILYSKTTICLFRKTVGTDSTCISDAMWYGKPVITNETRATKHLRDYVFFIKNAEDMTLILHELDDPQFYKKVSQKIMTYARKKNNIFNLLKKIN